MKIVHLPKSVALELTYRCNHKCKFCSCPWDAPNSAYPKGEELSVRDWMKVVDILYSKGVESFSLSGGEVLLKDGFETILRYIRLEGKKRGLDLPIVLISNARKMNEEYLHLFKELNTRTLKPLAANGILGRERYCIIRIKRTEVVDSYYIKQISGTLYASEPPLIICFL